MSLNTGTDRGDTNDDGASTSSLMDTVKVVIHALILALLVRMFLFQPFNIPSGSMKETLLVGDYLFVSKYAYGYSRYSFPFGLNIFSDRVWSAEPERGDVAVFKLPCRPRGNCTASEDYIKRIIGLPGDRVQMRQGVLFLNGEAIPKVANGSFEDVRAGGRTIEIPRFTETLPNGVSYQVLDAGRRPSDNTGVYVVPEGHYFMLGDNRDNSQDSRAQASVGFVPAENLVGRAEVIFFSANEDWSLFTPWSWGSTVRWVRFFDSID